jgi:hypothetical protein
MGQPSLDEIDDRFRGVIIRDLGASTHGVVTAAAGRLALGFPNGLRWNDRGRAVVCACGCREVLMLVSWW